MTTISTPRQDDNSFHCDDTPRSTGVTVLRPLVDVIHIVDPKLNRLHLLPAWREPLPLQRVAPVCGVSVVVDVVLPATDGPVDGPAGGKGEVLSGQTGEVPQRLGLYSTYACGKTKHLFLKEGQSEMSDQTHSRAADGASREETNILETFKENTVCGKGTFKEECAAFQKVILNWQLCIKQDKRGMQ